MMHEQSTISVLARITGGYKSPKTVRSMRGWKPINVAEFCEKLDAELRSFQDHDNASKDLEERCHEIEKILVKVADKCRQEAVEKDNINTESRKRLHSFIE